jgi:hypothetical protein
VRESNPPHLLGRQRPKAARPTPLAKNRGLCVSLYGSPSPCDGSLRAPDFGRGFSGGVRARILALETCLPPALRRRQGQSELDTFDSGQKLPE